MKHTTPLKVSYSMTGKMTDIPSLSTCALDIDTCIARHNNPNTICSHCYAMTTLKRYKGLRENARHNAGLLKDIMPIEDLPKVNAAFFRFESFGEIFCANQVVNYFNICRINPNTSFALWTKNPGYIAKAIKMGYEKPDNLQIVISSPFLNHEVKNVWDFADRTFTVYSKAYLKEHDLDETNFINCGSRDCLGCNQCYRKNGAKVIRERQR